MTQTAWFFLLILVHVITGAQLEIVSTISLPGDRFEVIVKYVHDGGMLFVLKEKVIANLNKAIF